MFIIKDIVHNDFKPSILPEMNSNLAEWHKKLVKGVKKWQSLSKTKQRLKIEPINYLILEEMREFELKNKNQGLFNIK